MTTATLVAGNRTMDNAVRPRRSLEELVDRLMNALFKEETETPRSPARSIHKARRLRQAGQVDGALAVLASVDVSKAETDQVRWAFAEWKQLVRRRFGRRDVLVYSQGTGRAAALVPTGDGTLEALPSWGCGGGPARSSRGAASGACGP